MRCGVSGGKKRSKGVSVLVLALLLHPPMLLDSQETPLGCCFAVIGSIWILFTIASKLESFLFQENKLL